MKTTMKKISAFMMAACLLISLAACQGPGAADITNGSVPSQNVAEQTGDTLPVDDTQESASHAFDAGSEATSAASPNHRPVETVKPVSATTKPSKQNQKPSTTAEIVAYFNAAANKVKTEKPGLTKTEKISFQVQGDSAIAGIANQVQKALKNTLNPDPITVKKGASHNAVFPVENQSWASRLSADAVSSASCVEKNGAYLITIRLKDEHISYEQAKKPLQTRHGQVVDILKTSEIEEQMKGLSWLITVHDLDQTYSGTTITCTVDKQSQKMRSAHYRIISHAVIRASAPLVGDTTVNATLTFNQEYQF